MCRQSLLSKAFKTIACIGLMISGSSAHAYKTQSTTIVEKEELISESNPIVRAIDENQKGPLQVWFRSGHSPLAKITNKLKERLLDRAASHGSADVFDAILSELNRGGYHPKLVDSRGTPIIVGIASLSVPGQKQAAQYERMLESILRFSPSTVNDADRAYIGDGRTALHQAAANGNVTMIRTLIAHGAKVNAKNSSGETPLHLAARFGHIDAVRYLIYSGATINEKTIYTKATPLMAAAEAGHAPIIRALMASGANKNEKDTFGKTAPDRYKEYTSAYYAKNPQLKR